VDRCGRPSFQSVIPFACVDGAQCCLSSTTTEAFWQIAFLSVTETFGAGYEDKKTPRLPLSRPVM